MGFLSCFLFTARTSFCKATIYILCKSRFLKSVITHNFFIVAKFEVVLDNAVFVFLDLISIKMALLNLLKVPCYDKLASRSDYSIF